MSNFLSARYLGIIFGLSYSLFAAIKVDAIQPKDRLPSDKTSITCGNAWGLNINELNLSMVACTSNNSMEYECAWSNCQFPNSTSGFDGWMFKECVEFKDETNDVGQTAITFNVPAISYEAHSKDSKSLEGFTIVRGVGRVADGMNAGDMVGNGDISRYNCSWTPQKPQNSNKIVCKDCRLRAILKGHA